jgi:8-oxo-dGTP diphosphatase
MHSVSVAAVITNDAGEVLIIQRRDNGHWEPPGGVLETDESIFDGLRREVHEETGLAVQPDRLTGVYKNIPRAIIALVFRAHIIGGILTPSPDEVTAVKWVPARLIHTLCTDVYAIRVTDALTYLPPAIRAHDGLRIIPSADHHSPPQPPLHTR